MCAALGIAGGPAAIIKDGPQAVRNRLDPRLLDVNAPHPAKAPLWAEFVHALATDPDNVWIITARLHHPETIHAALTMLASLGLLPAVPKPQHIWPVAHPGFPARFIAEFPEHPPLPNLPGDPPLHWSRYKAELLSTLMHRFARETPAGNVTLCKFSDDDHKNVEATLKYLPPVIAQLEGKVAVQVYSTAHVPPPSMAYIDPSGTRDPQADLALAVPQPCSATHPNWHSASLTINTSNKFKAAEFRTYLLPHVHALDMHAHDLPEPDSDPLTIMRYKASHVCPPGTICDDTSLEIPDAHADAAHLVGTNIKWGAHALDALAGKRALFVCMLGRVRANAESGKDEVAVYRGETWGTICLEDKDAHARLRCAPGFLPWFVPDDGDRPGWSLARYIVEGVDYTRVNPRWIAVQDLLAERAYLVCPTLDKWQGKWQKEDEN
ncbi:hypothetical protein BCR44DRAFT_42235 [Catenaria anguillulae PL171]|uniref:Uncharacterized protein n=1 Tax=Catenaria anguillulae PL171 TaxID=765915 RepID=A0A1Y2HAF1_9FUNG|nr:hypothetical protein BCR44DRAFT_42235 [Catenaria anguillulae PL171]